MDVCMKKRNKIATCGTIPSLPYYSYMNTRILLLLTAFLFLASCADYLPYSEIPIGNGRTVLTNIKISGDYVPSDVNQSVPVLVYYPDATFDYGFLNSLGEVWIKDTQIANLPGKTFMAL
jgi:hypothetical protein